jgi:hypothetical protein
MEAPRRLVSALSIAKSLRAHGKGNPGTAPGFNRDLCPYTFATSASRAATSRLWQDATEIKLTRKAALVLTGICSNSRASRSSKHTLFATVWRGTLWSATTRWFTCVQELRKGTRRRRAAAAVHRDAPSARVIVSPRRSAGEGAGHADDSLAIAGAARSPT